MVPPPPKIDADTQQTMNQFREFLLSYNKISEMCFNDCIHDFTTRKVADGENSCASNCMDKYLKMTQRISQRFQEFQLMNNETLTQKSGIVA